MIRLPRASAKTTLTLLLMMGVAFMMPACGDDDDDGGGGAGVEPVDTGLPDDKTLSDLDEGDQEAICDAIDGLVGPEVQCVGAALFIGIFSEDAAACQATFDACIADPEQFAEDNELEPDDEEECSVDEIPEDCSATVGELEACFSEQAAAIQSLINNFQCAELLASEGEALGALEELGPACQAVEEKCPGIFDDGDDDFNNDSGFFFSGSGKGCGGDVLSLSADITGEATSVEIEIYIGDEAEIHPMNLESDENGEQFWSVALETNGTFEAGVSTAFNCDQFGEFETITRASGPEGDICEDSEGPRGCP